MRSQAQREAGLQGTLGMFWLFRQYPICMWLAQRNHSHVAGGWRCRHQKIARRIGERGSRVAMGQVIGPFVWDRVRLAPARFVLTLH
jgi:hypothetical protein